MYRSYYAEMGGAGKRRSSGPLAQLSPTRKRTRSAACRQAEVQRLRSGVKRRCRGADLCCSSWSMSRSVLLEVVARHQLRECGVARLLPVIASRRSRECVPDDRLREAIHRAASPAWIASSLSLLAMTAERFRHISPQRGISTFGRSVAPPRRANHAGHSNNINQ